MPRNIENETAPWGPDGALLCNFAATTFKLNLRQLGLFETFEYAGSHLTIQELEVYASEWKIAEARTMTAG